jgi:hypothetical protein
MKFTSARLTMAGVIAFCLASFGLGQPLEDNYKDAARVTVAINPDGSRTVYEFDNARHKATAATTAADGKLQGKIRYEIDDFGRFSTGTFFGPDGKFRFKSLYKYDHAGRVEQETHFRKDDSVINKFVYSYNEAGKQTGYAVYDSSGKLIASSATPTPSPKARRGATR